MLKLCVLVFLTVSVYAQKDMALTEIADEIAFLADQELATAAEAGSTDETMREQYNRIRPRMLFRLQRLQDIRLYANKFHKDTYGSKFSQLFNSVLFYRTKYFLSKPADEVTKAFGIEGLQKVKKVATQIRNRSKRLLK